MDRDLDIVGDVYIDNIEHGITMTWDAEFKWQISITEKSPDGKWFYGQGETSDQAWANTFSDFENQKD